MVEVGQKVPDLELVDSEKKTVRFSDYNGKPTVLLFYPGAFTGVCTKEMCTMRDGLSKYSQLGVQVVGISVDGPIVNHAFKTANNINFPLLSDFNKVTLKAFDHYQENFAGVKGYTVSKRAAYVLDKDSVVRFKWVSDNPGVEPDYEAIAKEAEKVKA